MQMVWHGAIGVKAKEETGGALREGGKNKFGSPRISEVGGAGVTADGDEMDFQAQVGKGSEAGGFAVKGHGG